MIRAQLDHILATKEFTASKRNSGFLRYVVKKELLGQIDLINGYNIGVSVFGKPENFDPQMDPIVRTQAVRLRRALKNYYYEHQSEARIVISMPPGQYIPEYCINEAEQTQYNAPVVTQDYPPKIAVLPFVDLNPTAGSTELGEEFSREMAISLTRFDHVAVFSNDAVNRIHKVSNDIQSISTQLGAQFVLRGSFRHNAKRIRVTVELVNCDGGALVWGDNLEMAFQSKGFLNVQNEIVSSVSSTIADIHGIVPRFILKELTNANQCDLSIQNAILQFQIQNHKSPNLTQHEKNRARLSQALKSDPSSALAWACLSEIETDDFVFMHNDDYEKSLTEAHAFADKAVRLDPRCQYALWAKAYAYFAERNKSQFLEYANRAIDINPNSTFVTGLVGWTQVLAENSHVGYVMLEKTKNSTPYFPDYFHIIPCIDALKSKDYQTAYDYSLKLNSQQTPWGGILRSAALSLLDKPKKAVLAFDDAIALSPILINSATLTQFVKRLIWNDEIVELLVNAIPKYNP